MKPRPMRLEFATERDRQFVLWSAQWILPERGIEDFTCLELGTVVAQLARERMDLLRAKPGEVKP